MMIYTNLQSLDKDYQKTKFTVGTNQQWFVLTQDKIDDS